jgi:hypothetical protein
MIALTCKVLIAASLVANAMLTFALWRPESRPSSETLAAAAHDARRFDIPPALSSETDRALITQAARFGRTPAMGDPHVLAKKMLGEGYPSEVVSAVVVPMLDEWRGTEAIDKAARQGSAIARRLKAMLSDGDSEQKYLEDLFPHVRERAEENLARERSIRFGHLTMEKILAIERVEVEFAFKPNQRSSYNQANATAQENIEGKIDKALRRTLTPDEMKDYWRFNSLLAYQLQKRMNRIDIDESTYDRLLGVAKRQENIFFQQPLGDFRGILSDSQFVQLIGNDSRYKPADNLYRAAGLSEAQRGEFYALAEAVLDGRSQTRSREIAANALNQIRTALAGSPEIAAEFETCQLAKMLKGAVQRR